jgi:hypothetical protein
MDTGIFRGWKSLSQALGVVAIGIVSGTGAASAGDIRHQASVSKNAARGSMEIVYFTDGQRMPVKVVRGTDPSDSPRVRREITTFGTGSVRQVAVFRGTTEPAPVSDARPADAATSSQKSHQQIDALVPSDRGRSCAAARC